MYIYFFVLIFVPLSYQFEIAQLSSGWYQLWDASHHNRPIILTKVHSLTHLTAKSMSNHCFGLKNGPVTGITFKNKSELSTLSIEHESQHSQKLTALSKSLDG